MRSTSIFFVCVLVILLPLLHAAQIRSVANSRYVSAELGRDQRLRARATVAAQWEQFTIENLGGGAVALLGDNGLYVSAELGFSGSDYGMLRARAALVGSWERFKLTRVAKGNVLIQSLANNLYVAAELGYTGDDYGTLRARTAVPDGWELFRITY